jgi:hypothetical protein
MENEVFRMCIAKNHIKEFEKAFERVKKDHNFESISDSSIKFKQISPQRPYLELVWYQISYSRAFLIFLLGKYYKEEINALKQSSKPI